MIVNQDEYGQPFFSDESVNLNCVLSWRARDKKGPIPTLRIDFHNSFFFDSALTNTRPELLQKALRQLNRSNRVTGTGSVVGNPERYLNEHTLKFQFSELFPSSSSFAGQYKAACALAANLSECTASALADTACALAENPSECAASALSSIAGGTGTLGRER